MAVRGQSLHCEDLVSVKGANPSRGALEEGPVAFNGVENERVKQVDHEEEGYPDDVDEVPVVRHANRADLFVVREILRGVGAREDEEEGDKPAKDVEAVEARGEVED